MEAEEGLLPIEEEEDTDQPSTSNLSKAMKMKQPPSTDVLQKKLGRKSVSLCPLDKVSIIYPSEMDCKQYLQAGVDDHFISSCQRSSISETQGMDANTAPLWRKKVWLLRIVSLFLLFMGNLVSPILLFTNTAWVCSPVSGWSIQVSTLRG